MSFSVRPLEFETRGLTLRGSAYVPCRKLIVRDRGPASRLRRAADRGLPRLRAARTCARRPRTLAVVAMDRAGHGESDGDFADTVVSNDIVDSLELIRWIAGLGFVDADDLHLVGISMGAVIASVVAAETRPRHSLTHNVVRRRVVRRRTAEWNVAGSFDHRRRRARLLRFPWIARWARRSSPMPVGSMCTAGREASTVPCGCSTVIGISSPRATPSDTWIFMVTRWSTRSCPAPTTAGSPCPARDFVLGETVHFVASHALRRCRT